MILYIRNVMQTELDGFRRVRFTSCLQMSSMHVALPLMHEE